MKVLKWLDLNFEKVILCTLLVVISVVMMLAVVMRYCTDSGLIWGDELCRYAFVVSVFLGASYSVRYGALFRMSSVVDKLSPTPRYVLELFMDVCMIVFFIYFGIHGFGCSEFYSTKAKTTEIMKIPYYVLFALYAVCMLMTAARSVQKLVMDIIKGPSMFLVDQKAEEVEEYIEQGRDA